MVARFSTLENQLNYQMVAINIASTTGYSFLLRTRKGKKRGGVSLPILSSISHPFSKSSSRDLTKPRRRRQRDRQKAIGLISKTTNLHVHHAFLYISLPFLHNHGVKWPIFEFTWVYGNGKTIDSTIFVWTRVRSPLFVSKINSLLLSNWATWIMAKWSERMLILFFPSDVFYGRRLCRIVGSLVTPAEARRMQYTVTLFNTVPKKDLKSK